MKDLLYHFWQFFVYYFWHFWGNFTRWILGQIFQCELLRARSVCAKATLVLQHLPLLLRCTVVKYPKNVQNMYKWPLISSCFWKISNYSLLFLQVRQLFQYSIQNYNTSKIEWKLRILRGRIESFCLTGFHTELDMQVLN